MLLRSRAAGSSGRSSCPAAAWRFLFPVPGVELREAPRGTLAVTRALGTGSAAGPSLALSPSPDRYSPWESELWLLPLPVTREYEGLESAHTWASVTAAGIVKSLLPGVLAKNPPKEP